MPDQVTHAETFRALHVPGNPLILYNIWDAGSAKAVAAAGASALATGSWSVAASLGFGDGERLPLDLVVANIERIVAATDLPVTADLESGYGADARAVGETVERALRAGAVGFNLEDSFPKDGSLRDTAEQVERLAAARAAADRVGVPAFMNARTDVFFQGPSDAHDDRMAAAAVERARAYAAAGADGLFVPGLIDERLIARVVSEAPLPVNIMMSDRTPPIPRLAALGVARVSYGPAPYLLAMKKLEEAARRTFDTSRAG